jgi:hypothetical protein
MFFFLDLYREDIDNTLRVLVATDCHLGYMEKDEIRRFDSFHAFEEICSVAEQKQVLISLLSVLSGMCVIRLLNQLCWSLKLSGHKK